MATKKHKAPSSTRKQPVAVVPVSALQPGESMDERMQQFNRAAFTEIERNREGAARQEARKRLSLTNAQVGRIGHAVVEPSNLFAAVRPLAWLVEDNGDNAEASGRALEAISELGCYKASAIASALGQKDIAGNYDDQFEAYARSRGYVRKGAGQ